MIPLFTRGNTPPPRGLVATLRPFSSSSIHVVFGLPATISATLDPFHGHLVVLGGQVAAGHMATTLVPFTGDIDAKVAIRGRLLANLQPFTADVDAKAGVEAGIAGHLAPFTGNVDVFTAATVNKVTISATFLPFLAVVDAKEEWRSRVVATLQPFAGDLAALHGYTADIAAKLAPFVGNVDVEVDEPVVADFYSAFVAAGLGSTLVLCYDLGSDDCYPGTGTTITDLTGHGNNATLPVTGRFHGTAGDLDNVCSIEGPASGSIDVTMAGTWDDALHRDGQQWTMIAITKPVTGFTVGSTGLFSNLGSGEGDVASHQGVRWEYNHEIQVAKGSFSGAVFQSTGMVATALNLWDMAAVSWNENGGASGSFFRNKASSKVFNANVSSPGTGNASGTPHMYLQANLQVAAFAVCNRNLTALEISALQTAMSARFPDLA